MRKKTYLKLVEYQTEQSRRHLGEVQGIYREMRGYKHDFHNHLQTLKGQLENGQTQRALAYLEQLDRQLMEVDTLLVPEEEDDAGLQSMVLSAAEDYGVRVSFITEEERLEFGKGVLTIFPPLGEAGDNERGLAVLASAGENDFLITGDMDAATEAKLLETYDLPDIEALAAGHHGSKYATSQALLEALRPETACISVGSNSYGHPTEETLLRLARQGCDIYRTDLHGTVHLAWNQEDSYG